MMWTPHARLRHFFVSNFFCSLLKGLIPKPILLQSVLNGIHVHDGNVWQDFLVNPMNPSEIVLTNVITLKRLLV